MSDSRQAAWRRGRPILVGFAQMHHPHQPVGPPDQFLRVPRRSRQQFVQSLRGADQAVLAALGVRQHRVKQAFAHPEGRKHDGLRVCDADDVFKNQRRIGQQRTPRVGDGVDIGQHIGRGEPPESLREIQRLRGRNRVAVHHAQGITALDDVDPGQRTPGPADRIEGAATAGLEAGNPGQFVLDDAFGAFERFVRQVLQRQAAERQRDAAANLVAAHVDQFERAAAEIADDTVGLVNARDDAKRRQLGFARAGQDFDRNAADAFGLGDEIRPVGGVAARGGGDRINPPDPLHLAQRAKAAQRRQRLGDRVGRQQAGALHLAAEAAQALFVEDRDEAPRHRLIDDETNRVRADVDDRDAGGALARPPHLKNPLWGMMAFAAAREPTWGRFLERLSTA